MISIRKKIINAAVKCRIAKENYQAVDSTMINKNCKEYKLWGKAFIKFWDLLTTEEGTAEIVKNGIVTIAELDAAYNKKMGK